MFEYTGSLGEIGIRWQARARAEGLAQGLAKGLAKGRAEGLAKGRAEGFAKGFAKGLAKGRAEDMAWVLREKFGPEMARKAATLVPEGKFNMKGIGRMVLAFDTEESFLAAVREKFSG